MSWAQSEIVQLLTFLAPGLVSLVVFYGLTSLPKPSEFERVVQALIFTLVAQSIVAGLQSSVLWLGPAEPWSPRSELIISVTIGFVLGLLAAIVTNTDIIHRPLRRIGITQETSYPSVWYSTFQREKKFLCRPSPFRGTSTVWLAGGMAQFAQRRPLSDLSTGVVGRQREDRATRGSGHSHTVVRSGDGGVSSPHLIRSISETPNVVRDINPPPRPPPPDRGRPPSVRGETQRPISAAKPPPPPPPPPKRD